MEKELDTRFDILLIQRKIIFRDSQTHQFLFLDTVFVMVNSCVHGDAKSCNHQLYFFLIKTPNFISFIVEFCIEFYVYFMYYLKSKNKKKI